MFIPVEIALCVGARHSVAHNKNMARLNAICREMCVLSGGKRRKHESRRMYVSMGVYCPEPCSTSRLSPALPSILGVFAELGEQIEICVLLVGH